MISEKDENSVLVVAKKVDDAINEGLAALGATLDEVKVEVVESGGLFRKAKVKLTLEKDEPAETKKDGKHEKESDKAASSVGQEGQAKVEKQAKKPQKAADTIPPKPVPPKQEEAVPAEEKKKPQVQSREEEAAAQDKAFGFVKEVVALMGFTAQVDRDPADPELINIDAPAGDDSLLIGRHGETLSALSYLAETGARADKTRVSVTVDCNGYRGRRAASLTAMARRRADEAVNKGRRIKLEPMERIDRRTVHNALTGDDRVSTASEGKEPYRFVVITPKDEQKGGRRHHHRRDRYERGEKQEAPVETESEQSEE